MIERIFSKTQYYLAILVVLVVYFLQEKKVLNFPNYINVILFLTAFVSMFLIAYRYDGKKRKTVEDHVDEIEGVGGLNVFSAPLLNLLGIAFISFTLLCLVKIPILYYIESCAKSNSLKSERVEIDNLKLRRNSVIYVKFRGEVEKLEGILRGKRKLGKKKLLENYDVQLEYRESILGTSVLESFKVVKKKMNINTKAQPKE